MNGNEIWNYPQVNYELYSFEFECGGINSHLREGKMQLEMKTGIYFNSLKFLQRFVFKQMGLGSPWLASYTQILKIPLG